jgi:HSP20 family protein
MDQSSLATTGANLPSVNLKETDKKLKLKMAAPGLKNKTSKWKSRTCFLQKRRAEEEETVK